MASCVLTHVTGEDTASIHVAKAMNKVVTRGLSPTRGCVSKRKGHWHQQRESTCYFCANKLASHAPPASKEEERQLTVGGARDLLALKPGEEKTRTLESEALEGRLCLELWARVCLTLTLTYK